MKSDYSLLLADLEQATEAALWRKQLIGASRQPLVDSKMTLLEEHFEWDGMYLDLFGEWDRDEGYHVEDVAPAGTTWSFGNAFSNEQISQMGAALDRAWHVKKAAAHAEALILNREWEAA